MLRLAYVLYLAALLLLATPVHAAVERSSGSRLATDWQPTAQVTPLERALFQDSVDGRLDQHSLIQAVLVACGANDTEDLVGTQLVAQAWLERMRGELAEVFDPRVKAVRLLEHLHDDLLRDRYRTECSDLRRLLQQGEYNCVGAAVMYVAACEVCGLNVVPQELPGHVRCRVWLEDRWQIVEPTCRDWLSGSSDSASHLQTNTPAELRAAYQLADDGRLLSTLGLVAMIYYNQGLDRLDSQDWSGAFTANQKALQIDPQSRSARANLLAIWNNWALQVSDLGDHRGAAQMLERGLRFAPEFGTFQLNLGVIQARQRQPAYATQAAPSR